MLLATALLLSTLPPLGPPQTAQDPQDLPAALEEYLAGVGEQLAAEVEADGVGGMSIALIVGDDLVWQRSYGLADVEKERLATNETIYRTGSISKSVTALLLCKLVDDEAIELDDPVHESLEELLTLDGDPNAARAVTFRQLASHTSGLIREPSLPNAARGRIDLWEDKILESIPTTSFLAAPGERYSYSNIGYGILGLALSRASEQPFRNLVTRRLFEPAGMTRSFFVIPEELRSDVAVGTANGGGQMNRLAPAFEHLGRGYKVPNGGVYATAADLCRLLAYTRDAGAFSDEIWNELQGVQTPESPDSGYGLGFSIEIIGEQRLLSHGGSVAGYTAHWALDPDRRIGVAVLRNYNQGRTNLSRVRDVTREVARLLE